MFGLSGGKERRLGLLAAALLIVWGLLSFAVSPRAYADGVPFQTGDVLAPVGNGMIKHFNSAGTLLDTLDTTSGSSEGTGMCFDQQGNLYTTNFSSSTMSKFDKNGNLVAASFGSGFSNPESCAFNNLNQMYVGQAGGGVLQFDTNGTLLNSFSPAPESRGTDWIDLAADQHTLRYTSEGSSVKQFDVTPPGAQLADFATGLPAPCYAHRVLQGGGELLACSSQVVRLDASGAQVQSYPVDSTNSLFALNVDPDGTSFWTANFAGTIWHVDIATGTVINTFNAAPTVDVAGLAIVGELTVASDPKVAPTAAPVRAVEGTAFTGTVATFTDADTQATASEYSASITWGDGSTSTGTVSGSGGNFTVSGSHAFAEEGSFPVTVAITDADKTTNSVTASATATVADAALHAHSATPTTKAAVVSGTVATFTDDDPKGTVSDYTASINWGDGTKTSGTVASGGGKFGVRGSHSYKRSGTFKVTVTIKDRGGSTATASETVKISNVQGKARLIGAPHACVRGPVRLVVEGKRIASVKWFVDGTRITGKTISGGTRYRAMVSGSHRVTAEVKFVKSSGTRGRTFHVTVTACPVTPKFTG